LKRAISGLRAWIIQRFTAVFLLLFFVVTFGHFAFDAPHSYSDWHNCIANPFVAAATLLFFATLLLHAWVGLRDVMVDYIKPLPLRVALLALLAFVLIGLFLWTLQILIMTQGLRLP
jgi:succinate dehydrogenase / fumarate reductase membrane anchor subunit